MKLILVLLFAVCTTCVFAQETMMPYRVGIVVRNADAAAKWYEETMGFVTYKKMDFPAFDSLQIRFLRRDSFELELIAKKTSVSIQAFVPGYDMNNTPLQGFAKIAFKVKDINRLYQRLKQKGVKEVMGITQDNTFNSRFFLIEDPDGNLLQFIELGMHG